MSEKDGTRARRDDAGTGGPPGSHERLDIYMRGPDRLGEAVAGLSDAGLDLARTPGEWTIRQIVHHLADGELHWATPIKMALAESGRTYAHNLMDEDRWAEVLDYGDRPVESSLALIRALRAHVADLVRHLPDAWERHVSFGEDAQWRPTVAELMAIVNRHFEEHVEEILETRRRHNL